MSKYSDPRFRDRVRRVDCYKCRTGLTTLFGWIAKDHQKPLLILAGKAEYKGDACDLSRPHPPKGDAPTFLPQIACLCHDEICGILDNHPLAS